MCEPAPSPAIAGEETLGPLEATLSSRKDSWQVLFSTRAGVLSDGICGKLFKTRFRRSLSQRGGGRVWLVSLLRPMGHTQLL